MGSAALAHPTSVTDASWKEPSRAAIMKAINTRRWPSIEMQARPDRYKWTPTDGAGTGDKDKDTV
jgi:hypothetical protein